MKNIIVVTGASSGLGREFVRQLDAIGADEIWGIALEDGLQDEIQKEIKTKFKYFALDLTKDESFETYKTALKQSKANVSILVNCSGFGKFGRYDEIPLSASANMIDLNCKAYVKMTGLTLPFMNDGARIIQVASVAAFQPIPYIATYGDTKAFVLSYSRALNVELKHRNISVTCLCPFWTKTNFFKRAIITKHDVVTNYTVMYDSKFVVEYALKRAMKRKELAIPGYKARKQVRMVKLAPHGVVMNMWVKQQKLNEKYNDKPLLNLEYAESKPTKNVATKKAKTTTKTKASTKLVKTTKAASTTKPGTKTAKTTKATKAVKTTKK